MAQTAAQLNVLFTSQGADRVKGDLKSVDDSLKTIGTAYAAAGAAGVGALGLMANASMQLESAMANVNSIAGLTEAQLGNLTGQVQSLSAEMGKAPTEMADALYEINSSGFEAADAMEILEKSSIAAGAGLTTVDVAATATTAVLNAYGDGAEKAGDVTDVLFKTVDSGVLSFEALAKNLGQVLPIAATLGVEIEELGAAYAQMTLQGISAAQSETAIAAVLRSSINETTAMTEAVQEYGYASAEALIHTEGLAGYLEFLAEASGGSSAALTELLGTADATVGALALMKNEGADFNAMLLEMEGAAQGGAYALGVFQTQTDTTAFAIQQMTATLQNAFINMGDAISPAIRSAAESVTFLGDQFNNLSRPAQDAVATFTAVASGAALFGGSLMLVIPKIVEFRKAMASLRATGSALAVLSGALGPLAIGIAAVAAGAVYLHGKMNDANEITKTLEASFDQLGQTIQQLQLGNLFDRAEDLDMFVQEVDNAIFMAERYRESEMLMADARRISAETGEDLYVVINRLREAYTLHTDGQERLAAAMGIIDQAFLDQSIDAEKLSAELARLKSEYDANNITLDEYVEGVILVSKTLSDYGATADTTTGKQRLLRDQMAAGVITYAQYTEAVEKASRAQTEFTDKAVGSTEGLARISEFMQKQRDWVAAAHEAMGTADPLSQWNMTARASEAAILANNLNDAVTASEGMFSVVVGGTDAIKNHADAVMSWAENLIAARGEVSRLDELVNSGLITGTSGIFDDGSQYAMAQDAYDSIVESTGRIHDNLDAVQAIQAPLIAELLEGTANYTEELLEMDAATQLVALGWMDSATAAKAMEIATLGAAAASGELGDEGAAAFEKMVIGAAHADPVLKMLLIDMGIISEGADGTITVHTEGLEGARSDIDRLNESVIGLIDYLQDGVLDGDYSFTVDGKVVFEEPEPPVIPDPEPVTVPEPDPPILPDDWWHSWLPDPPAPVVPPPEMPEIEPISVDVILNTSQVWDYQIPQVGDIAGAGQSGGGGAARFGVPESVTVTLNVIDNVSAVMENVAADVLALSAATPTVEIHGDATDLFAATEGARSEVASMPKEATVYINGDESDAMASISAAAVNLGMIDGSAAMIYINGNNANAMAAIGEIQAYNGATLATSYIDIVTRKSEVSLTAHAMGGYVSSDLQLVGERGPELVSLPQGSYVHTAGETRGMMASGSRPISINFNGNFYGSNRQELDEWGETALIPAIVDVLNEERRGQVRA